MKVQVRGPWIPPRIRDRFSSSFSDETPRPQSRGGGNVEGSRNYESPVSCLQHSMPEWASYLRSLCLYAACICKLFFLVLPLRTSSHLLIGALCGPLLIFPRWSFGFFLIFPIFFISARREHQTVSVFDAQSVFCLSWLSLDVICMDRDWIINALQSPPSLPTVIFANPTTCLMNFPNVASRPHQTLPLLSWLSASLKLPSLSGNWTLIYNTTPKLMFWGFHLCSVHSSNIGLEQQRVSFWIDSSHFRTLVL